jgi:hypothetical protein
MADIQYVSPRLTVAVIEDVNIAVHGVDSPDATDWEAYMKSNRKIYERFSGIRGLVYTLGGNPSTAQRSELNKLNEGKNPRVSVMVESRLARGAVTAISWFNPGIRAFALDQLDDALAHLELSAPLAKRVRSTLAALQEALRDAR